MPGPLAARRNPVDVHVEQPRLTGSHQLRREDEIGKAGLLASLPQGDVGGAALVLGVAAELHPDVELAMMREKQAA